VTSLPHSFQVASEPFIVAFHHAFCRLPSIVPGGLARRTLGNTTAPPRNETASGGLPWLAVRPASSVLTSGSGSTLRGAKNTGFWVSSSGIA